MTTSGYLSSSREGKLPEPRLLSVEADFNREPSPPMMEKKVVTMKKIIEGMKRPDESSRKKDKDKDSEDIVDKKLEKVKEKTEKAAEKSKKKRKEKEKEMEEFAFFEKKEKPNKAFNVLSSEPAKVQSPKQKLNIFRKLNKSREAESVSPSPVTRPAPLSDHLDSKLVHDAPEVEPPATPPGTPLTPRTPSYDVPLTPSSSSSSSKKLAKKEKKLKGKKVNLATPAGTHFTISFPMKSID